MKLRLVRKVTKSRRKHRLGTWLAAHKAGPSVASDGAGASPQRVGRTVALDSPR